jgi:hypothetical protein
VGEQYFGFVQPPFSFLAVLALLIVAYLLLAEGVKRLFYKRNLYRIEQVLIPKRRVFYLSRSARLVQDIVAVVCLRPEPEISVDSLIEDLQRSVSYPVDSDQVLQSLHHLRRGGLVTVDWHKRVVKREGSMKDYVKKRVVESEIWSTVFEDWLKIGKSIQDRYGRLNTDFESALSPKQRTS